MNKWMIFAFSALVIGNILEMLVILRLWDHRRNAILTWAATEEWVGLQNSKTIRGTTGNNKDKIVLLGASITQAFDQKKYFPIEPFINCGANGHLSGQYLLRFKQDVIEYHPKAVIIKLCAINITRDVPMSISCDNIQMMSQLAVANDIQPILASIIPITEKFDKNRSPKDITKEIKEFNKWLRGFANKKGFGYIDFFTKLADNIGFLKDGYSSDGLHLNLKGYEIFAVVLRENMGNII